ncbi:hypothetical protein ACJX0J_010984, partial [Zea mays]
GYMFPFFYISLQACVSILDYLASLPRRSLLGFGDFCIYISVIHLPTIDPLHMGSIQNILIMTDESYNKRKKRNNKGKTFLSPLEYRSPYKLKHLHSEIMVSNYFLIFICCTSLDGNEVGKFVVYQPYTIHILYREDQQTFCDCRMPQWNGFVVLINVLLSSGKNSLHAI